MMAKRFPHTILSNQLPSSLLYLIMDSFQDNIRHTCCHCQAEVLTIKGSTQMHDYSRFWQLPFKHATTDTVREAALSGCPFFVILWKKLVEYWDTQLSQEMLKKTTLDWLIEAVKLKQTPVAGAESAGDSSLGPTTDHAHATQDSISELYDITGCEVQATEDNFSWYPCGDTFTALSDWGMASSCQLFSSALIKSTNLLTFSK